MHEPMAIGYIFALYVSHFERDHLSTEES